MNIYFLIIVIIYGLNLGIRLEKYDKAKKYQYEFWLSLISTVISLWLTFMAIKTGF